MAKKILAISGGIDSMVMLDLFQNEDIVVAHFDHGTRKSSAQDAAFVQHKASKYGKKFFLGNGKLGENTAEETARVARYDFLKNLSLENQGAEIYTAHHLDDLVESIAINLVRGTGWRGLAVLDTPGIRRPFLESDCMAKSLLVLVPLDKKAIQKYAAESKIIYRQDPTNNEDTYLRNRLRQQLQDFKYKKQLYILWGKQKKLKREIDQLIAELIPKTGEAWQRSWFLTLDQKVAIELLRAGILRAGISATRPQLEQFRQAILSYVPGKYFNLPGNNLIKLNKLDFYL